jgi:hypothetical protein
MKIYRCDKCKKEQEVPAIVGTEFELKGFGTIAPYYRVNGLIDLCPKCFSEMDAVIKKAQKEAQEREKETVINRLLAWSNN